MRPTGAPEEIDGNHRHAFDASAIDVLAIYCPAPKTFIYLLAGELPSAAVNLRLSSAKNGQVKRTRDASHFSDPRRMFGPVAFGREEASVIGTVAIGKPS